MKILLAGDSTVTEQPREAGFDLKTTYCGWGQMLPRFFQAQTRVLNFADSGLTVESFRENGFYKRLCAELAAGDFVLIQFGHNDQKLSHLRENGGYAQGLERYLDEVRERGGVPVLVTSVARNSWRGDNGEYNDLLAPYAQAVHDVGARKNAPVLDLHAATVAWVKSMGLQDAKRYFHPGDYTHPNDFGGFAWAKMLAQCIAESGDEQLAPLRDALLCRSAWPEMELARGEADAATGWCAPPQPKANPAAWLENESGSAPCTAAQALIMARTTFGYFVARDTQAQPPMDAFACALENGYLPQAFPCEAAQLEQPVNTAQFTKLMQLACRGRNRLSAGVVARAPQAGADGTLSCSEAACYTAELERLATGCVEEIQQGNYRPAGS